MPREPAQLERRDGLARDACGGGQRDHLVQQVRGVLALGDEELAHFSAAGGEKLTHGAAPFDLLAAEAALAAV